MTLATARAEAAFLYAATARGQIFAYSVDETNGALGSLSGFPVQGIISASDLSGLLADETNGRLFALSPDPFSVYEADPSTGTLAELSFSPVRAVPGLGSLGNCFALHPSASPLLGAGASSSGTRISSTTIRPAGAIPSPGSPYPSDLDDVHFDCSIAFTSDGRFAFVGGGQFSTGKLASVEIDSSGVATPVPGSPFDSGLREEVTTVNVDAEGRLFVAGRRFFGFDYVGAIRVFTTELGVPTPVLAGPLRSGLGQPGQGLLHPAGFYILADARNGVEGRIGVYRIEGSGVSTRLELVAGSPFPTGDQYPYSLALSASGSLLFVGHRLSGNITTFSIDSSTGTLARIASEQIEPFGSQDRLGGLSFMRSCGDGAVEPGEQCDDGNRIDGDCCSRACTLNEEGASCDDGNDCAAERCDGKGTCLVEMAPDGIPCDDRNPCSAGTTCAGGACAGGVHVQCVDAFECRRVHDRRDPPFSPQRVFLSDQFGPIHQAVDPSPARLFKPKAICSPVGVDGETILDPDVHFTCYGIGNLDGQIRHEKRPRIEATDRFGTLQLELTDAETLCVPSKQVQIPPGPIGALAFDVSETRIRSHIAALEAPRDTPPARAAAAAYIASQLESYGYSVLHEPVEDSENVIAVLSGAVTPQRTFIVGAHFDTVTDSPGADDNASGVAGLLEIARVLAQQRVQASIEFVAFGLEEIGLKGSTAHAAELASKSREVVGMISLEMIAYTCQAPGCQFLFANVPPCLQVSTEFVNVGTFIAAVANEGSSELLDTFVAAADRYVPALRDEWARVAGDGECFLDTRRSDHAPFWDRGYPALMVTDTANFRNPNYHEPTDRLRTLDLHFAQQVTQAVLATALESVKLAPSEAVPKPQ